MGAAPSSTFLDKQQAERGSRGGDNRWCFLPQDGSRAPLSLCEFCSNMLSPCTIHSKPRQQLDTADKARCSPLACFDPPRGFDPTSLSVGSSLFPGRSPPIPMTTVRSSSGAWARRQRRRRPPERSAKGWVPGCSRGGASLGAVGDGRVQDERGLLDPLWTALVKVNQLDSECIEVNSAARVTRVYA